MIAQEPPDTLQNHIDLSSSLLPIGLSPPVLEGIRVPETGTTGHQEVTRSQEEADHPEQVAQVEDELVRDLLVNVQVHEGKRFVVLQGPLRVDQGCPVDPEDYVAEGAHSEDDWNKDYGFHFQHEVCSRL